MNAEPAQIVEGVEVQLLLHPELHNEDPDIVAFTGANVIRIAAHLDSEEIRERCEAACEYIDSFRPAISFNENSLGLCSTRFDTEVVNGAPTRYKYYQCAGGSAYTMFELRQWYSCSLEEHEYLWGCTPDKFSFTKPYSWRLHRWLGRQVYQDTPPTGGDKNKTIKYKWDGCNSCELYLCPGCVERCSRAELPPEPIPMTANCLCAPFRICPSHGEQFKHLQLILDFRRSAPFGNSPEG